MFQLLILINRILMKMVREMFVIQMMIMMEGVIVLQQLLVFVLLDRILVLVLKV